MDDVHTVFLKADCPPRVKRGDIGSLKLVEVEESTITWDTLQLEQAEEDLSLEEFKWVQDTNLTSAFVFSQAMYPYFKKAGAGKIINIGSMYSLFGGPVSTAYSVSKGGMVQMTKSMAAAWGTDKIQVNAVLPGWIDTELTRTAREQIDGLYEKQLARIPDGRWGTPEDHAGIAVFLSSNASNYITGTAIPVDGGFSISG